MKKIRWLIEVRKHNGNRLSKVYDDRNLAREFYTYIKAKDYDISAFRVINSANVIVPEDSFYD